MGIPVQSLVASGLPTQARIALEDFMRSTAAQVASLATAPVVQQFAVGPVSPVVFGFETLARVSYATGTAALTIAAPQAADGISLQDGYRVRYTIANGTAGVVTTSWASAYKLAGGAWADPASGKRRSIEFQYDFSTKFFNEQWRTPGDV